MKPVGLLLVVLAVMLAALSAGLRPDAFYAGDPGVKLTAALNAVEHPSEPFNIALPTITGTPVPHVEQFFAVHDTHAHAVTSELFPVLTAPFLRLLGMRGLYVLPALGYLVAVAGCAWLAVTLDRKRQPLVAALVAALATPWLFYALEFWEHTLALGLAAVALPLLLRNRGFASGVCFGAAILLRPEAAWLVLAVIVGLPFLSERPRRATWVRAVAGGVVMLAPYLFYTWRHFGTLPLHLLANRNAMAPAWSADRIALLAQWFGPSTAGFWRAAPALLLAVVPVIRGDRFAGRGFLLTVCLVIVVLVALTAPNDGGAQWGPRYLLFAFLPLVILTADAAQAMAAGKAGRTTLVAAALLALWMDRTGYKDLRATKNTYGRVVDFVAQQAPERGYVISDVWWLDQVAAAPAHQRQWLYVPDDREGRGVVKRLSDATVPLITVVRLESGSTPRDWIGDSCYFPESTERLAEQNLVAVHLRHRCGSGL